MKGKTRVNEGERRDEEGKVGRVGKKNRVKERERRG